MIKALSSLLAITLAAPTHGQSSTPLSPCPNVFMYEPSGTEPGRWYGVVNLSTDSILHSLWLNIVLDSKADILGNWIGDVTTTDNTDFKIENTKMKIHPGPAQAVRFFVQYNPLNKAPKLLTIRLNGREICNANNPLPAVDRPDIDTDTPVSSRPERPDNRPTRVETTVRPVSRPDSTASRPRPRPEESRPVDRETSRPASRPADRETTRPDGSSPIIRPEDRPNTKPVFGSRPSGDGPVYVPTESTGNSMNANPYSIGDGQVLSQSTGTQTNNRPHRPDLYQATTDAPVHRQTTRPADTYFEEGNGESDSKPDPDDYFTGGQPVFIVSSNPDGSSSSGNNFYTKPSNNNNDRQYECGKVIRNNPNPLVVNGKPTLEGQWPWQIALYQTQTVDNKYICGGTLVSRQHVITAAHCITRKGSNRVVNKNTLTVYLGKHNLRTSVEGVQIRLVGLIAVHPQYNASAFSKDLSILNLREAVTITDWVRPACLWPENEVDLTNVIGRRGSVVGWGFDSTGVATEELTLVEMPVVDQETCIRSYSEFFSRFTSEYTFCAGYRNGTSVCNGDSGGGMVFNLQNTWYLRGLVSLSVARQNEYRCDPTHYVVFTDLAKFLPWIKDHVGF